MNSVKLIPSSIIDSATVEESDSNSPVPAGMLKFEKEDSFYRELRRRVEQYFQSTGKNQRDCPRMYLKTALILGWLAASYVLLVFFASSIWIAAGLAASLALAMAAVGFNIQHDGGHNSYSEKSWINKITALSLELLGGSSYIWARKHNVIHHSYANITGHDEDINIGFLGRLSPHDKRFGFHRFQQFYLWALYGFLPSKWQVYDDFRDLITGRIGEHRFVRPRGWDLAIFFGGKALFFSLAFVIPLLVHSFWTVLGFYLLVSFIQGIVLSVVFQLSHCVEMASFPMPDEKTGRMEAPWAVHQIQTTVNYACTNRLLTYFVGGLNFQIEHHLFPRICHVHYPAIAPLVEQTCREFDISYRTNQSVWAAMSSHFRWLQRMGMSNVELNVS